jgi:hypothetical protein
VVFFIFILLKSVLLPLVESAMHSFSEPVKTLAQRVWLPGRQGVMGNHHASHCGKEKESFA